MKLDAGGQGGGKILDLDGQGGWGVLKIQQFSCTSYAHHPLNYLQNTSYIFFIYKYRAYKHTEAQIDQKINILVSIPPASE